MQVVIENKDTHLCTTVLGNPEKETVILLHGGPGVPGGLSYVQELLAEQFQVVYFEHRGTRDSPCYGGDYSMESYISDIDCIAHHFKLQSFHLFGHSWGGLYAQVYAESRPYKIKSLFLCSPMSGTGRQGLKTLLELIRFNISRCNSLELAEMTIYSLSGAIGSSTAYMKLFEQISRNFNRGFKVEHEIPFEIEKIRAKAINGTTCGILRFPVLRGFRKSDFKVSITYGDKDVYGSSKKYLRRRYPAGNFFTIPNSGHLPWEHNRQAFVNILTTHFNFLYSNLNATPALTI